MIESKLSEGHARSLLRLIDDPIKLEEVRNQIIENGLTVRQTEKLIKKILSNATSARRQAQREYEEKLPDSFKKALTTQLTNRLNSKISIVESGSRGKIEIEYYSLDDFERVMQLLIAE